MKACERMLHLQSLRDRNEQKYDGNVRKCSREYVEALKVVIKKNKSKKTAGTEASM